MITLEIENKEYKCPSDYSDITFSEFKKIQAWLDLDHNKEIVDKIIDSKVTSDEEERVLNFYLDFINYVTKIPKKHLMQIKPYGKDNIEDLSIQWVFERLSFLLCVPQIENPQPAEKLNGYYFIDRTDLNEAMLRDLTFREYVEADAVKKEFNKLKEGRYDRLAQFLAIMYRPKTSKGKWFWKKEVIEEYNSETVRERAKEFDNITMDKIWNCLFFFMQLKTKSLKNIEQSLKVEVEKARSV